MPFALNALARNIRDLLEKPLCAYVGTDGSFHYSRGEIQVALLTLRTLFDTGMVDTFPDIIDFVMPEPFVAKELQTKGKKLRNEISGTLIPSTQ